MKVAKIKIADRLNSVRPTERKIKKAKLEIEQSGILPKELPLEKKINWLTQEEAFERVKDSIQIALQNIKGSI